MERQPNPPVAISYVGSKYLIFDISVVTWLRKAYHICGVMGGTLPQSPSQNLFLGLPVQIMPEEAQLLVEKGVAYIVDDIRAHDQTLLNGDAPHQEAYIAQVRQKGELVTIAREEEKEAARRQSLKKPNAMAKSPSKMKGPATAKQSSNKPSEIKEPPSPTTTEDDTEVSLFDSPTTNSKSKQTKTLLPHCIVPTTSELWLPAPTPATIPSEPESRALLPNVPSSYALYKHLNSKSYFMTPGLRFGCQYCVYPGDPLRFHSHFLAVGKEWEEEIDLMDLVTGGRLGTGVKKGFLIGGSEPPKATGTGGDEHGEGRVRTFSVEWAAM